MTSYPAYQPSANFASSSRTSSSAASSSSPDPTASKKRRMHDSQQQQQQAAVAVQQQAPVAAAPVAVKKERDPYYGHEEVSKTAARFIISLFACPNVPPPSATPTTPPAPQPTLAHFVAYALHRTRLPHFVTLVALVLLQRLKDRFPAARGSSGHRLFISAFMIASKVVCDDTYSNQSWCVVGQKMFSLKEMNQMEREMCGYLEWCLNATAGEVERFEQRLKAEHSTASIVARKAEMQLQLQQQQQQAAAATAAATASAVAADVAAQSSPRPTAGLPRTIARPRGAPRAGSLSTLPIASSSGSGPAGLSTSQPIRGPAAFPSNPYLSIPGSSSAASSSSVPSTIATPSRQPQASSAYAQPHVQRMTSVPSVPTFDTRHLATRSVPDVFPPQAQQQPAINVGSSNHAAAAAAAAFAKANLNIRRGSSPVPGSSSSSSRNPLSAVAGFSAPAIEGKRSSSLNRLSASSWCDDYNVPRSSASPSSHHIASRPSSSRSDISMASPAPVEAACSIAQATASRGSTSSSLQRMASTSPNPSLSNSAVSTNSSPESRACQTPSPAALASIDVEADEETGLSSSYATVVPGSMFKRAAPVYDAGATASSQSVW